MFRINQFLMLSVSLFLLFDAKASTSIKHEVVQSCRDYQNGVDKSANNLCKVYINGFIDAAILANDAIVGDKVESKEERSALFQRALKYRTSEGSIASADDSADFCIPSYEKLSSIKSNVINQLNVDELAVKSFKFELHQTLAKLYPC